MGMNTPRNPNMRIDIGENERFNIFSNLPKITSNVNVNFRGINGEKETGFHIENTNNQPTIRVLSSQQSQR